MMMFTKLLSKLRIQFFLQNKNASAVKNHFNGIHKSGNQSGDEKIHLKVTSKNHSLWCCYVEWILKTEFKFVFASSLNAESRNAIMKHESENFEIKKKYLKTSGRIRLKEKKVWADCNRSIKRIVKINAVHKAGIWMFNFQKKVSEFLLTSRVSVNGDFACGKVNSCAKRSWLIFIWHDFYC